MYLIWLKRAIRCPKNPLEKPLKQLAKEGDIVLIAGKGHESFQEIEGNLYPFNDIKIAKTFYGIGFDIHKLVKNKKLYLGGIKIPFHSGLKGHSDGDVILHAIIDAILGATRKKDVGTHFPNIKKFTNIRSP